MKLYSFDPFTGDFDLWFEFYHNDISDNYCQGAFVALSAYKQG